LNKFFCVNFLHRSNIKIIFHLHKEISTITTFFTTKTGTRDFRATGSGFLQYPVFIGKIYF